MTLRDGPESAFERTLTTWLAEISPEHEPADLLERVLATTAVAARRPAWWGPWARPRFLTGRGRVLVPALGLATIALATVWLVLVLAAGSGPHLPIPLGRPGLLVAGNSGELLLIDQAGKVVNRASTGEMWGIGAWSHDGRRLAHADGPEDRPDLVITDEHLTEQLRIPLPGGTNPAFSWSPDDRRIAFAVETDTDAQVYVVDLAAGARPRAITDVALHAIAPAWSPDGDLIAFRGGVALDQVAVYVVHPDGSGLMQVSREGRGVDASCGLPWTPDGRSIVFATGAGVYAIWIVDRDGGNERMFTSGYEQTSCPSVSPDGTRIAAVVWGAANRLLTIFPFDRVGKPVPGVGKPVTPDGPIFDNMPGVWSPDGLTVVVNGRVLDGGPNPRAFIDPSGVEPARKFQTDDAFVTDWQRLPS